MHINDEVSATEGAGRKAQTGRAWLKDVSPKQWWALFAVVFGNMLDAFDVMVYSFALTTILAEWSLSTVEAGLLATVSLLACSVGGVAAGGIADRLGRKRSIVLCIGIFTVFAGLSAFSQNLTQLAISRGLLGLGWGGMWTVGVLIISESWPAQHRSKALALANAGWPLGYLIAAAASTFVLPTMGWRALFLLGVLPGFAILWIIRHVEESPLYLRAKAEKKLGADYAQIFRAPLLKSTIVVSLISTFMMFGYWGLFTWLPGYLSLPPAQGGLGLSVAKSAAFMIPVMLFSWVGQVLHGVFADRFGRRPVLAIYLLASTVLIFLLSSVRDTAGLMALAPFMGFFASGAFAGIGALLSEAFPTSARGVGVGFTYNFGRGISAFAPLLIGWLAGAHGLAAALATMSAFYLLATGAVFLIPETREKVLD